MQTENLSPNKKTGSDKNQALVPRQMQNFKGKNQVIPNQSGRGWATTAEEVFAASCVSSLGVFPLVTPTSNYMISHKDTFLDRMDFPLC